jgi:hypothetical protein
MKVPNGKQHCCRVAIHNLTTAKALRLKIPEALLLGADELIE